MVTSVFCRVRLEIMESFTTVAALYQMKDLNVISTMSARQTQFNCYYKHIRKTLTFFKNDIVRKTLQNVKNATQSKISITKNKLQILFYFCFFNKKKPCICCCCFPYQIKKINKLNVNFQQDLLGQSVIMFQCRQRIVELASLRCAWCNN